MNRRLVSILGAVVVLGGGGFFIFKKLSSGTDATMEVQYKLAKVEVGQVKKTVSASGTLQAWKVVDIKARTGGELSYLGVDVGSEVKAGQVLARIDPLDVQLTLNQAQADATSARAREAQSSRTYLLQVQQSQIALRDAEASLRSAEANYLVAKARLTTAKQQATTQPDLTNAAIASAKANWEQAKVQRAQLDQTTRQQRAAAEAAYKQAVASRTNAQQQLDRQKGLVEKGFVSQQAVDTATANLEVAEANILSTKTKLDTVDAELRGSIDAADARVNQTRAAYDQALAGQADVTNRQTAVLESEATLKQSEAAMIRARIAVDQARANRANNEIRRYDVAVNAATIARASASVFNAKTALQRTTILAPMSGTVLTKTVEQGTIIASALGINSAGQNIMQIGDTSRMYVNVTVDETDIANVDLGQKVDISVEAYPGVPFEGKVIRVDPQAVVNQNVTQVNVRVEVDNSSATFRLLKPGMNTTCEFVVGEKSDVIAVSNDAIKDDNDGSKYVEVATGGKPAPPDPKTGTPAEEGALIQIKKNKVKVTLGLEGNDMTEVKEGVKEGDQVVTQTIEPEAPKNTATSPFGGGGMRGGMGGGGRR